MIDLFLTLTNYWAAQMLYHVGKMVNNLSYFSIFIAAYDS